jgi:superfamily II RNA helicase
LTLKGSIANQLNEVHCLLFTELILHGKFKLLNSDEIASILSCFTNITVTDDLRDVVPNDRHKQVQSIILELIDKSSNLQKKELSMKINTGEECNLQFDIINYTFDWCQCNTVEDCKYVLQEMNNKKDIFLGEFVKALLKINNITNELEKVAELIGDIELLHKLREIPQKTLKYVATNQSLYI